MAGGLLDMAKWLDIRVRDWRVNDLVVRRGIVALRVSKKEFSVVEAPVEGVSK